MKAIVFSDLITARNSFGTLLGITLFVSAFKRANELATAMECRCYHGGEGRTRLRQLKTAPRDYVAIVIMLALFAGIIVLNCIPVIP